MSKWDVYAYNTHYVITNYTKGDLINLERKFSLWDDIRFKEIPRYYYDEEHHKLFLPRGYDPNELSEFVGKPINFINGSNTKPKVKTTTFTLVHPPKNNNQTKAIRFLCGMDEFEKQKGASQLVLSLPTSVGKTYCSVAAIYALQVRALVTVPTEGLREQWKEEILAHTNLMDINICTIDSSRKLLQLGKKTEKELSRFVFFISTRATLGSFLKSHSFEELDEILHKLGIGVKIVDEAHKEYERVLMLDYATNIWKTFYVTATFARSDDRENQIYQRSFNFINKLGKDEVEMRKHTVYIPYIYKTNPSLKDQVKIQGRKKFNRYAFIDYALQEGTIISVVKEFLKLFIDKQKIEGKIVILSSKKDSCDVFLQLVQELYPSYKSCVHYTGHKVEDFKSYGIICSTPQMIGTGENIPKIRVVINTEPSKSSVNAIQYFGRLREFAEDKDTYYVEPVDKGIDSVFTMYKRRRKIISTIAKSILTFDTTIIR